MSFFCLVLVLSAAMGNGQEVWKSLVDQEGRTIEVEILAIRPQSVVARKSGGVRFELEFAKLSEGSRAMLSALAVNKEWVLNHRGERWRIPQHAKARKIWISHRGGQPAIDESIIRSLDWLKSQQNADGSWSDAHRVAMTGLALRCFSGHGASPLSAEYGECYLRGLTFLIGIGEAGGGKLTEEAADKHWVYAHGIATEALAEAVAQCRGLGLDIPGLEEVALKASQWIIDNQNESGGWEYSYDDGGARGGDLSISAWQLGALGAARESELKLENWEPCLKLAQNFVWKHQRESGGFSYTSGGVSTDKPSRLTGAGICSLRICGAESDLNMQRAVACLVREHKFKCGTEDCDLYRLYYHARAMIQGDREHWLRYQDLWRDDLLEHQDKAGFWKVLAGPEVKINGVAGSTSQGEGVFAVHYRTCLATLILETYYR